MSDSVTPQPSTSPPTKKATLESVANATKVGRDLVAACRDTLLLVIGLLILIAPSWVGRLLTDAGFTKGNVLGFEWASRAEEASGELTRVQAALQDLQEQYEKLKVAYGETVKQTGDARAQTAYDKQVAAAAPVVAAAAQKQEQASLVVAKTIDALRREPELRAETPTSDWALVLGGDRTLADAKNEVVEFNKIGMKDLGLYLRQGSYRTVARFGAKEEAAEALQVATRRRKDAYIVNLSHWCPKAEAKGDYFVCN